MRTGFAALARAAGPVDLSGLALSESTLGPLRTLEVVPKGTARTPIVHLHGGGYVFGSPESHLALGVHLARAAGRRVILPAYPLAPEEAWPAQREAVLAGVATLQSTFVLSGDSAGGHLALACALHGARPDALLLFSPNTSRAYGRSRSRGNPDDAMNAHAQDDRLAAMAFGRSRAADPDQTLLERNLSGLPPTFLDLGSDEILRDEGLRLAQRAGEDGVRLTLRLRSGFHMIQLFAQGFAPGARSLDAAGAWLRAHDAALAPGA
nr:alpha/beta hydrolase [Parvularcula dongshanensis]